MSSDAGGALVFAGYQRASDEEAEMRRTGKVIPGGVLAPITDDYPPSLGCRLSAAVGYGAAALAAVAAVAPEDDEIGADRARPDREQAPLRYAALLVGALRSLAADVAVAGGERHEVFERTLPTHLRSVFERSAENDDTDTDTLTASMQFLAAALDALVRRDRQLEDVESPLLLALAAASTVVGRIGAQRPPTGD